MIGNSSAGIREAPYYDVPTVDIGSRQFNRAILNSIFNCDYKYESILETINRVNEYKKIDKSSEIHYFGEGQSDKLFFDLLQSEKLWKVSHQKQFKEIF